MNKKPKRHGLTQRQRQFVSSYLKTLNKSEAARATGYKGNNAHVIGARLYSKVKIREAIESKLKEAMGSDVEAIKHRVLVELQKEAFETDTIITMQTGDTSSDRYNPAKMKALELLAKYGGLLIDRQEVTGKDGAPIVISWPNDNNPTP